MDVPARPPMLPAFGSVRAWMMTPADIVRERPGPPPSTSSQLMAREVAEVQAARRSRHARRAGDRQQLGRRSQHADAARPLELHRRALYPQSGVQRGAGRAGVRAPQHGPARCRRRMLGREVLLLQSASLAHGSRAQVDHRPAELPVIYVRALDVLGGGSGGPVLPVPERCGLSSRRRRRKPRSRGCMAAFTIEPTSRSGKAHGKRIGGYTVSFAQHRRRGSVIGRPLAGDVLRSRMPTIRMPRGVLQS